MSYPYDKTYLEQIQESKSECKEIEQAFKVLRHKFVKDSPDYTDSIELPISEQFRLLGEAFELASYTLDGVSDDYHFMWDVVDALLTPKENNGTDDSAHQD